MRLLPLLLLLGCPSADDAEPEPPDALELIEQAGNAGDEGERYRLLVAAREVADAGLAAELDTLLPAVDVWANGLDHWVPGDQEQAGEDGYLGGFLLGTLPGDDPTPWPEALPAGSVLEPIRGFYRGRGLIWRAIQDGILVGNDAGRDLWFGEGRGLIAAFAAAYPHNPVAPMYLDQPVPWTPPERVDGLPDWANDQRVALSRMADIVDFWVEDRQAPDGQFGGGWGDDVEIWRHWTSVLLGFEYAPATEAWRAIADGIWALPRLAGGYTDVFTDVEHSSEDTADTLTPMLLLGHAGVWAERADGLHALFEGSWSGTNERGFTQFQSTYFGSEGVSDLASRACDTAYHARALQPALLRWQRGGELPMLEAWLRTWVDAAAREERGKPAGVLPSAIHWPSGEVGGPGEDWWEPGCALNAGAFDWPSAMSGITRSLVLAWWKTGDDAFLEPLRGLAEHRRAWLATGDCGVEGDAAWVGWKTRGFLSDALAKHWLLTGSDEFVDLLEAGGSAAWRAQNGDRSGVEAAFASSAAALSINEASYTTEVRWTDRLFRFSRSYADHYAEEPLPRVDTNALYASVTGDLGGASHLPLPAVRWRTHPRDLAVLVTQTRGGLVAELVHFGEEPRTMGATLTEGGDWALDCGGSGSGTEIEITLPPRELCTLTVVPE